MDSSPAPGPEEGRNASGDIPENLLEVPDEVWVQWSTQWLENLAPTLANPTPEGLTALAELGNNIGFLARRFEIPSSQMWSFCTQLRLCCSLDEDQLTAARRMLLEVSGIAMDIRNAVLWKAWGNQKASSPRPSLSKAMKRQIFLEAAKGQSDRSKVAKVISKRLGIPFNTVRNWPYRDPELRRMLKVVMVEK